MEWYIQLIIYFISGLASFFALWQVDFNKFIRVGRKEYAIIVYIILSIALTFLVGRLFIEIGTLIKNATN